MEPSLNLIPKIKWPCNPWKYLPNLELEEMHSNEFSGNYLCRYFRKSKFITKKSEIKASIIVFALAYKSYQTGLFDLI